MLAIRGVRALLKYNVQLGVEYVDLYLIHHPRLATPDIPTAWAQMEKLKADGLVKSIGVSNFGVAELQTLVNSAKVLPAANQVCTHAVTFTSPHVWALTALRRCRS